MKTEICQIDNLLVDPTSSSTGTVRITGTIEVPLTRKVPESNNAAALAGIGIIGATFLLRRQVNNSR